MLVPAVLSRDVVSRTFFHLSAIHVGSLFVSITAHSTITTVQEDVEILRMLSSAKRAGKPFDSPQQTPGRTLSKFMRSKAVVSRIQYPYVLR